MTESAPVAQRLATAAQLRRMAKARPYVPLHEVRRTYGLPGDEEIATRISVPDGDAWIGLPEREARLVGAALWAARERWQGEKPLLGRLIVSTE